MTSFLQTLSSLSKKIKENLSSGLTVALISLPLSIALAIANGGSPTQGIITGTWAALTAALLGGSEYNVVGVSAALSSVTFAAVVHFAGIDSTTVLFAVTVVSGLITYGIYLLKLDTYLRYIPVSVMHGFATGVALLIAAGQLFDALGLPVKKGAEFLHNMKLVVTHAHETYLPAFIIFLVFFAFLMLWRFYAKKIPGFIGRLPGVIPASLFGIILGAFLPKMMGGTLSVVRLVDKFGELSPTLLQVPHLDSLHLLFANPANLAFILKTGALLSLIAVLETLITAKIGDRMTSTECDTQKELFGLGTSNIVSAFVGGFPSTGVFIRMGANIKAGATHRTSGIIAAIVTGIMGVLFIRFFQFIPMAVIAAILFNTAVGLIEFHAFSMYWKEERRSLYLMIFVILVTLFKDGGVAVIVGAVVGIFLVMHELSQDMVTVWFNDNGKLLESRRGKEVVDTNNCPHCDTMVYSIAGFLNYLDIGHHIQNIKKLVESTGSNHLVIRMRDVYQIDLESIEALAPFIKSLEEKGVTVDISSAHDSVLETLNKDPYFKDMAEHGHVFGKTSEALGK